MPTYLNSSGVPLSVAVYLATDNYDYIPNTISATGLLRPLRQTILSKRVPLEDAAIEVTSLVKARIGTAIHDGIETAWKGNYKAAMRALGYSEAVIERIKINPDPDTLDPKDLPVYMEQRVEREFMGHRISGKYDFIAEGIVEDFKSTSVNTWMMGKKDDDYQLQGSIYRWLNPKIITQDHMAIRFIFTDWMPGRAAIDPKYPNSAIETKRIPLLSIADTEHFIAQKLQQIDHYQAKPEQDIPECNDQELWRRDPQFKYYKNPKKTNRSTKNFDTSGEAYGRLAADGNVGMVLEVPGEVIACKYCAAFPICTQKDRLIADGSLKL